MVKKVLAAAVITVISLFGGIASAQMSGDLGFDSQYVNATDKLADNGPVVQGDVKYNWEGMYVKGWFSQSTRHPGFDRTTGNEVDLTPFGVGGKIVGKWSGDVHASYFDLADDRLFDGLNGDVVYVGGTLTYSVSATTNVYATAASYSGLGKKGCRHFWQFIGGVRTEIFGVVDADASGYDMSNSGGGFFKLSAEPKAVIAKIVGGKLQPSLTFWQPFGEYSKSHDTHVVVGLGLHW